MTYSVTIKKLRTPARNAPGATLIAHLVKTLNDGSQYISGAWFGNDRAELRARVLGTVKTVNDELNVWNS